MAIRKSAASEIRLLVADLAMAEPQVREAAIVRLSVIGVRAVPHLFDALHTAASPITTSALLKVLEATGDRRGIEAALDLLHARATDPKVGAAAVRLLGSHLEGAESSRALEELSALILDPAYDEALRLCAYDELERLSPRVFDPIRKWLAADPDESIRARATGAAGANVPPVDPVPQIEAVTDGAAADPATLAEWVRAAAGTVSLARLHRLIEIARTREEQAPSEADRREWSAVRGAAHLALASRSSRVALYDLREALEGASAPLPDEFVAAARLIAGTSVLEAIAVALARAPIDIETRDHRWRDTLAEAGRAIVQRERLTRRHAVIRKILKAWPDAGALLLA